ncbi:MAG: hypothetical protein WCH34_06095 [Bacteroidota bacterium]
MKTKIFITLIVFGLIFTAFKISSNKGTAIVDQKEGLYIFMLCKPVVEFDYLGSVKKGLALTGQPGEMLNSMIKKVKKDYPTADGIIFTSISMDKADAVLLKDK